MGVSSGRLTALLTVAALAFASGCGTSSGAGPGDATPHGDENPAIPVVASTNVYGDIARQIGGDRVRVVSIISDPAQDPHSYEASTRNQLELSRAKVVVENGGGYDDFVGKMLRGARNSGAEVVNAVDVSGRSPDGGGEFNEHVWYDLPTMGKLADRIADALAATAPADADVFRKNAATFREKLTTLRDTERQIRADHGGTAVAVTEPVPLYLIRASGLRNLTPSDFSEAVEEGDDVSARTLRRTLDLFADDRVRALVYNEQTSGPQTEKVEQAARARGIPVVPVTETLPPGEDYISWMTTNLDALRRALDTRP
ncbi:zinc ABC transporter substrate-binding protein [Streptomyces spongiicola]|uniref:ABC transporter substrate-binding protein n=1 Tax=Streptomyces spongiicola TaxID=1690221 RepID=A0ABN5KD65_9ACTN|nr:zinc ABC transporter substrate-binding protein [Streptomyces spongiicola]AWK08532.1 ABC transporter substrate-binding protein [Streptomyces spongiicola]